MTFCKHLLLLLAGLLVWQGALAQSNKWGLPPSPNGKLAAALLDAIHEEDPALHQAFIEAHYTPEFKAFRSMEKHLEHFQQMHRQLGGAEVHGIDMRMGARAMLDLAMQNEAGEYLKLKLELEQGSPPRIAGLRVEASEEGPPPVKGLIDALMAAISDADADVHRRFVEDHFAPAFKNDLPMERHLELLQQMHQALAGAQVGDVNVMSRGGSDETVNMVLKTEAGAKYTVTFDVQLSSPPRLLTLSMSQE